MAEDKADKTPPHEAKNQEALLNDLVKQNAFRLQMNETIGSTDAFPCIFVFSNQLLQETPANFLTNFLFSYRSKDPFIHVIHLNKLQESGLHVSFDVDELLQSLQPVLHDGEGIIRNNDNQFVKEVPRECYDTVTITEEDAERIDTAPVNEEEEAWLYDQTKGIPFPDTESRTKGLPPIRKMYLTTRRENALLLEKMLALQAARKNIDSTTTK